MQRITWYRLLGHVAISPRPTKEVPVKRFTMTIVVAAIVDGESLRDRQAGRHAKRPSAEADGLC